MMEITLVQSILIGLWTAFCYAGMLWGIYTNRCIVLSFGVGVILGDIPTALQCGAIGELAFMGFGVGAGGTVPRNPIGPGIIGTSHGNHHVQCNTGKRTPDFDSVCSCDSVLTDCNLHLPCRRSRNRCTCT